MIKIKWTYYFDDNLNNILKVKKIKLQSHNKNVSINSFNEMILTNNK